MARAHWYMGEQAMADIEGDIKCLYLTAKKDEDSLWLLPLYAKFSVKWGFVARAIEFLKGLDIYNIPVDRKFDLVNLWVGVHKELGFLLLADPNLGALSDEEFGEVRSEAFVHIYRVQNFLNNQ